MTRTPKWRRLRRPIVAGIVPALAVAVLCGCGSGGDPLAQVTGAARKTLGVTWARYELRLTAPSLFAAPIVVQGGRAAYDFRTGLGYEFLQLRLRPGSYQMLFCDFEPSRLLLAPSPAPAGTLPAGKLWISAPLAGLGADRALAAQAEGLAPVLLLDEVAWGARTVVSVGTRVVQSVPMHVYRVSVDLARALSAAGQKGSPGIASAIERELDAGPSERLSITVWVNGPGYVGQIAAAVPGSGLGAASFDFLSFTRPYTGTGPPAAQVVAFTSLERRGRSLWATVTGS